MLMLAFRLAAALIFAALPAVASASGITVKMGESWLFALDRGRPVNAHRSPPTAIPAPGQILVVLRPMFGSTMSVFGNLPAATDFRATLIHSDGSRGAVRACSLPAGRMTVVENWAKPVAAIHLDRFKPAPVGGACP